MTTSSPQLPLLLDTGIFSLFLKRTDSRKALYFPDMEGHILAISFVSVGELYRWPIERRWGQRRIADLEDHMRRVVVLPWHDSVARQWARIMAETPDRGQNDAWIAACAIIYGCTLVTDDHKFQSIRGLTVITH